MPFVQTLMAKLGLDGTQYKKGLDTAEAQTQRFASKVQNEVSEKVARAFDFKAAAANATGFFGKMQGLFAGGIGGMIGAGAGALGLGFMYHRADEQLDKLKDKAKEIRQNSALLDVDSTKAQQIANVTGATGSTPEAVAKAYEKIADAQQKIREGASDAESLARSFAQLGVTSSDLAKKDFHAIFDQIAIAMKNAAIDGNRLVALKDILGRSGPGLLPAFRRGMDGPLANAGLISPDELKGVQDLMIKEKERGAFWNLFGQSVGEQMGSLKDRLMGIFDTKRFFTGTWGKDLPDLTKDDAVNGTEKLTKRSMEQYERERNAREIEAAKARLAPIAARISEYKSKAIGSIMADGIKAGERGVSSYHATALQQSGAFSRLSPEYTSGAALASEVARASQKSLDATKEVAKILDKILKEASEQTKIQKDNLGGGY